LIATTRAGGVGQAETLVLPGREDGRVGLGPLLDELGKRGVLSLLVEGGADVHASFFAEGLVDRVQAYIAPILIGGRDAPGPIGGEGARQLRDAIRLTGLETTRIGDDLSITGYVDVHRDR
jgi:diaminohydroxyphosphoribosylaminopyrimidine deaminase/5-amino-6-(5-phosphoribosylamino)uracil reductase